MKGLYRSIYVTDDLIKLFPSDDLSGLSCVSLCRLGDFCLFYSFFFFFFFFFWGGGGGGGVVEYVSRVIRLAVFLSNLICTCQFDSSFQSRRGGF